MATVETDLDLFGRIKNGKIIEFPVYRLHIKNRSHPLSWYTPVVDLEKPELPAFHCYERALDIKDGFIQQSYTVRPFTLQELLGQLRKLPTGETPDEMPSVIPITEVDPAMIQQVYGLVSNYLTDKLIAFAATRGYGSANVDAFTSLMTYSDSVIDKFKNEALRGKALRDQAWANMLGYFGKVTAGEVPVPTSMEEIDALIPELTWE